MTETFGPRNTEPRRAHGMTHQIRRRLPDGKLLAQDSTPNRLHHDPPSNVRTSHNSGKKRCSNVVDKYAAPSDPPVPFFAPIMRSTMRTWRPRQSKKRS